jgi:SAM-dependent methyltransferase
MPDPSTQVVVNLGAGTTCLHPQMINVDFVRFPQIDVVADLNEHLPIRTESVDGVLSVSVFEHVPNAAQLAAEVARILKPGGIFYLATPFQYPYHGAPHDFTRWTLAGLGNLLGPQFEVVASGSRGGPAGVVILALAHAAAQVASFGSPLCYSVVNYAMMGVLSPLKYLDLLFERLPFNTTLCTACFLIARKKPAAAEASPREAA